MTQYLPCLAHIITICIYKSVVLSASKGYPFILPFDAGQHEIKSIVKGKRGR